MIGQKREKKTTGIIRRIVRWVSLSLLSILLILAVILQAPWKITILLAIFLVACTILPRQLRKWFWLTVGVVAIALILWIFLPGDSEDWRPYTFDGELAALEAKYAIPDEENAALDYDAIFETLDVDSNQPEFFLRSRPSSKDAPWLSKDHPEMVEWLKDHNNTIAQLMQAAQKDKCHFPIPADSFDIGRHMERLAPMRKCAFLLVSVVNNDMAEGRIDAGLEKYQCILRMADHLYQQPMTMDFLVGTAVERLALTQLNRFVIEGEPTVEQLQRISGSTRDLENNWVSVLKKGLECDKILTKNTFCSIAYEVNPEGKVRLSRDPIASFRTAYPQELPTQTYWNRRLHRAKAILAWFFITSTPQEVAEIIDTSYDQHYATSEPDYDWTKQPLAFDPNLMKTIITRFRLNDKYIYQCLAQFSVELSKETYFDLHNVYLKNLTLRRGSRILIAIKQYHSEQGTWPDELDAIQSNVSSEALIDPLNNGSYVYRLTEDGFKLYSTGPNGKDENGHYTSNGADDLSIWPPRQ
jgi:hypothetical protein